MHKQVTVGLDEGDFAAVCDIDHDTTKEQEDEVIDLLCACQETGLHSNVFVFPALSIAEKVPEGIAEAADRDEKEVPGFRQGMKRYSSMATREILCSHRRQRVIP